MVDVSFGIDNAKIMIIIQFLPFLFYFWESIIVFFNEIKST